jgi:hypothetical protein
MKVICLESSLEPTVSLIVHKQKLEYCVVRNKVSNLTVMFEGVKIAMWNKK